VTRRPGRSSALLRGSNGRVVVADFGRGGGRRDRSGGRTTLQERATTVLERDGKDAQRHRPGVHVLAWENIDQQPRIALLLVDEERPDSFTEVVAWLSVATSGRSVSGRAATPLIDVQRIASDASSA
jgi:hypothetical protein